MPKVEKITETNKFNKRSYQVFTAKDLSLAKNFDNG